MKTRTPHETNRLTAASIKHIKTRGRHADGGGLYLLVDKQDCKRWVMRIVVNSVRRDFGLGPLSKVTLAQARERADEYRRKAYQGIDPLQEKRERKALQVPTFEEAAKVVHEERKATWSNGKHVDQWINTLRDYAFPVIGKKPINRVTTADVIAVLRPIWTAKPETGRRVRQRLATVLDWARANGHRSRDNPVELIGEGLARQKRDEQHHAALPYKGVTKFITRLQGSGCDRATKLAFEFLILTAARTTEVRHALWEEIDVNEKLWTIPGDNTATGRRMKSGREHVVPLAPRCIEILTAIKPEGIPSGLIFPDTETSKSMSENRFLVARDFIGYTKEQCTPHGFRSSFRDWTAEETNFPSEVAEMALAHKVKSKVEAAYRRGHLLAKRRELMDAWATYVVDASTKAPSVQEPSDETAAA